MAPIHEDLVDRLTADLDLNRDAVHKTVELLEEGDTVPFIARYRREECGLLDIETIRKIDSGYRELAALRSRKRTILKALKKMEKLTPELEQRILSCEDKAALEDIFLPYKVRRDSIALIPEGYGLGPYAEQILCFDPPADLDAILQKAVEELENVSTIEEAREGIRDILAELFADDAEVRGRVRELARKEGRIVSRAVPGKENEASRFRNFYDFSEPAATIPSHRLLAIRRGEKEGFLVTSFEFDRNKVVEIMQDRILLGGADSQKEFLKSIIEFSTDRLLVPAIAREVRAETKRRADLESIRVFSDNLRDMLLAPPVGTVPVIGVDPGNRTGTRIAVVDETGKCTDSAVLFLGESDEAKLAEATEILKGLIEKHGTRFVAVGNGTTSRETEKVLRSLLAKIENGPELVMINEAAISIYASSDVAKDELPNQDVAERAAISMARRIQDPLAELVKIDPRSIGVGQYQHDVNQTLLREKLASVVNSCVNHVGVNVNSASSQLLSYISGLSPALGEAVIEHRKQNGPFQTRASLTEVKGIGAKTFEQCAGFLRVPESDILLDNTAIHPESYHVVDRVVQDLGKTLDGLMNDPSCLDAIDPEKYVDEKTKLTTVKDILEELKKPCCDPRETYQPVKFREDLTSVDDLETGMILDGRVSNVTRFGAFVDVGVHHDGLVHISEISDQFVSDPSEVVRVGQVVKVRVIGVDRNEERTRLSLSMKLEERKPERQKAQRSRPRPRRPKPKKERLRTLDDLLNRFGDPRKPRIEQD